MKTAKKWDSAGFWDGVSGKPPRIIGNRLAKSFYMKGYRRGQAAKMNKKNPITRRGTENPYVHTRPTTFPARVWVIGSYRTLNQMRQAMVSGEWSHSAVTNLAPSVVRHRIFQFVVTVDNEKELLSLERWAASHKVQLNYDSRFVPTEEFIKQDIFEPRKPGPNAIRHSRRRRNSVNFRPPVNIERSQAEASRTGYVMLYGKVTKVEAVKAKSSLFSGEPFYHDFKKGEQPAAYGLMKGLRVVDQEGRTVFSLGTRAILLFGGQDLWFMQKV